MVIGCCVVNMALFMLLLDAKGQTSRLANEILANDQLRLYRNGFLNDEVKIRLNTIDISKDVTRVCFD